MSDVLIVEDDPILREALAETMQMAGHSYLAARDGREALALLDKHSPAIVLTDVCMDNMDGKQLLAEIQRRSPGMPVILMTAHGSIEDAVTAIRQGAVDYVQKPFSAHTLTEKINRYIKPVLTENNDVPPIAQDPKSQILLSLALRAARSDIGVMISGESGTGKEVLAHFIHDHSPRKKHPFIAINCAAIPEQMLEATLFGYEKGAFTGAYKAVPGKFEQAQEGTLLLDEVSEMSLNLQAKLLRVLQEKEVERIGSNKLIRLNVRIIATSNRKLLQEVQEGRFREDLFYRLNVFPLHWLPLRERIFDIIPLANYLIRRHCQNQQISAPILSEAAKQAMLEYSWPGNARELDNMVQRALILQSEGCIEVAHLQFPSGSVLSSSSGEEKPLFFAQGELEFLYMLLQEQCNDTQVAAKKFKIDLKHLREKFLKPKPVLKPIKN